MKRFVFALPLVALFGGLFTTANAANGTLPGGTAISVAITSPTAGAAIVAGAPLTVTGTASVAEGVALKNTDLVFVLDTSGSTGLSSGGVPGCNTILACEKQAVRDLVAIANGPRSPIARVGAAAFPSQATMAMTPPASAQVEAFLGSLGDPSGGTDFTLGINAARALLSTSTAAQKLVVLLTDGAGTVDDGSIEAVVFGFAIAGTGCSPALLAAVGQGIGSGSCTVVQNLADLSSVITNSIGSSLTGVSVTVDGNGVAATTSPPLPVAGPGGVGFSALIPGALLTAGPHLICATATGTDAAGTGNVTDCVNVNAGTVVVNCAGTATCVGAATDPGKSTLAFSAPGEFNEQVAITPNAGAPGACGAGQTCRTGYDVGFPSTNPNGPIASLSVITTNRVSLRDRLNAAVFIDGTRITAQCNNRLLIKFVRDRFGIPEPIPCITISYKSDGRLEYFVKFNADPAFRFR